MKVDAVIVGGGPSGCSAAISLLRRGFSVAIVCDGASRERATETAAAQLRALLRQLGAEAALAACDPCYGISSNWGRASFAAQPSILNPLGNGHFVYRDEFDEALGNAAVSAGAKLVEGRASNIRFSGGVSVATERMVIEASWLVIATGSIGSAARITGQKPASVARMIGVWARLPEPVPERFLYSEATEVGWWYACPGRIGSIACLVTKAGAAGRHELARGEEWGAALRSTRIGQMIGFPKGPVEVKASPIDVGKLPNRFGERWIAVGDAAIKFDPIGSCGIAAALDSGIRAAEAIAGREGASARMSRYQEWGDSLFQEFIRQRSRQYELEASRRDGRFWHSAN
jgi:flavin-dependent dehydrogenase